MTGVPWVTWASIEAECGDYRAGFVATFRKYEGRDTDENDGANRIVKVTVASFARHFGIDRTMFRRWITDVDAEGGGGLPRPAPRHAEAARRFADKLPAAEKAKLAAELLEDDEVADDPVVAEAASRVQTRSLERDEDEMRRRGADPDLVEPFPGDLMAEAVRIANRADVSRDVTALLRRAEPDQRPALVAKIEPRVRRVLDALDLGSVTVPDYVPEDL